MIDKFNSSYTSPLWAKKITLTAKNAKVFAKDTKAKY
jgi:hypothetical protein